MTNKINPTLYWLGALLFIAPLAKGLYYEQEFFLFFIGSSIVFLIAQFRKGFNQLTYHPMDAGVFALVLAYLLSLPFAADYREALVGLLRTITYLLFYWTISRQARNEESRRVLLWFIFASGLASLIISFLVASGLWQMETVYEDGILNTTIQYKNAGALFLALCSIIGLYLNTLENSRSNKIILGIGQFFLLLGLIGTMSRGVWLLYPLAIIGLLTKWDTPGRNKAIWLLLFSTIPALVLQSFFYNSLNEGAGLLAWFILSLGSGITGFLMTSNLPSRLPALNTIKNWRIYGSLSIGITVLLILILNWNSGLAERIKGFSLSSYSVQERFYLYKDAWQIIKSHFIFGAGARGWDALYLNIQSYAYYAENVHNDFLQLTLEAGIIGLLAFITCWFIFISSLGKRLVLEKGQNRNFLWTIGIGAALMGLHSFMDFDLAHSSLALTLWTLFALNVSYNDLKSVNINPSLLSIASFMTVLIMVLSCLASGSFYLGTSYFAQGESSLEQGDLLATRDYFKSALTFDPYKTNTAVSLAQINLALADQNDPTALEEALYYADQAVKLRPSEPLSHFVLATSLMKKGEVETSIQELESYVTKQPNLLTTYEELAKGCIQAGRYYLAQGDKEKAKLYFEKTISVQELINNRIASLEPSALNQWSVEPKLDSSTTIPQLTEEAKGQLLQLN